ncbi:MAG TPA: short-chain dehydrogenase [Marinobacter hydrocarbonoclasticus]|jgi:NAD(P)-dependent dehydrogenase (short-subunit alcohol dehydrogenase family)|uniref:Short-chain dehydrogenase n=1 Tax=Marinobacter nauticus TaxID=2743 RepID=A0A350RSK3_MARNT|nr:MULTISPECIES: SDR family oxidoreductase [Marinobacter]MEC9040183.1 SDR family oxidoreductase [Pseudomonadota bacterium]MAC24444.1 short-chain dehydrogenase [Marinobacter sp.]MEC9082263.1 SDR family oxidoreductase [Pseudomonadota bacterium]MED5466882.1 SDR family oxidoreductase [Pseudomonadota bacterium]HAC26283.1 short-chain dehydrogenase [Marinobacter nauticus]|tara:strand:- start:405 stop:1076 length:672 start_codon:yes stop_codon:yes gene_type:complete
MSDSNVVVITGANRGVGLELARHYAAEGCEVIGVCRQSSEELAGVAGQVIDGVDVTTDAGIDKLKSGLAGKSISLLINNAGLLQDEQLGSIDFDSIRTQMEINAYAPLRVAEALVPLMGQGSKIANITSRMGSIADNDSGGRYGYRASKAALNAFGKSLAVDLKPRGIAVAQLHPGYVKTRMVNFGGLITPEESARGLAERIANLTLENTGSFWHSNGEELPW